MAILSGLIGVISLILINKEIANYYLLSNSKVQYFFELEELVKFYYKYFFLFFSILSIIFIVKAILKKEALILILLAFVALLLTALIVTGKQIGRASGRERV